MLHIHDCDDVYGYDTEHDFCIQILTLVSAGAFLFTPRSFPQPRASVAAFIVLSLFRSPITDA